MSKRLHLVASEPTPRRRRRDPFGVELPRDVRLPPGRHGLPADLVAVHQRQRLVAAVSEALAEHGYARLTAEHVSDRAGVSIRTFYKHFDNLWDCLHAAYETAADQLCEEIELACQRQERSATKLAAGIDAALTFLSTEPALAQLLGGQPPLEAPALAMARRRLISRLTAILRSDLGPNGGPASPPELDERPIDAALTFISGRVAAGGEAGLAKLSAELAQLLGGPRRAA